MPTPCPGCNKLASLETQEPELENSGLSGGTITAEFHVVRQSACCGEDMKEYTFELEQDVTDQLEAHLKSKEHLKANEGQEDSVDDVDWELEITDEENTESGGNRYRKNMLGVTANFTVKCLTCSGEAASGGLSDAVAASDFEEMV